MTGLEKSNPTHAKILAATRQLFIEKGIHKTSLADISTRAGISRGTLFYYYKSKNELVYDIIDWHYSEMIQALVHRSDALVGQNSIQENLKKVLDSLTADKDIARLNLYMIEQSMNEDGGEFRDLVRKKYGVWKQMLHEYLVRLAGGEPSGQELSGLFLAVIDGILMQLVVTPEWIDTNAYAEQLSQILRTKS